MIQSHMVSHPLKSSPQVTPQSTRPEKVKRPDISSACTPEDWGFFSEMWSEYKDTTKITGQELITQLTNCCDKQLRQDLFRYYGPTSGKTENDVFSAIKNLAVKKENLTVARYKLIGSKQDRDEPIRKFVARLKGLASICKYTKTVPAPEDTVTVDFADNIIRDVLVKGIADITIQNEVLGLEDQEKDLDTLIALIEAKEAGRHSSDHLSGTHSAGAVRSTYKRQQTLPPATTTNQPLAYNPRPRPPPTKTNTTTRFTSDKAAKCEWCGRIGHGNVMHLRERQKNCPAYGRTCGKCGRLNHLANVCWAKTTTYRPSAAAIATNDTYPTYTTDDHEEATFLSSYGVFTTQ